MSERAQDTSGTVVPLRLDRAETERRHSIPDTATSKTGARQGTAAHEEKASAPTRRVGSVDALRGFSIFWIISADGAAVALAQMLEGQGPALASVGRFVGTQFTHVPWQGFVFYDFIFPLLIFVTGVSIPMSLARIGEREGKAQAHLRVLRRAALLFVLGVLFYGGMSKMWPEIRLLGVLQRIALCYLFASLLYLHLRLPGLIVTCVGLLVGYWALMTFVPVPGFGVASYAEGANLANWIDQHYLPGRKWNATWDPEGLLSTLPAIATALLGVFAGMLLMQTRLQPWRQSLWLVGGGAAMVAAGYLWGTQFPIVKSIWTSSFVLVAGGYSLLLLGLLHQIIDVWGLRAWAAIFVWIGANAITLYFLNNVASFERFATRLVGGDVAGFFDRTLTPGTGRFVAHVVGIAIAIALAAFLYRRKIFLRV